MIFIVKVLATMRDFVWFSAQYELLSPARPGGEKKFKKFLEKKKI